MTPEVAVIMPAYNAERTIRRAVESLVGNAHPFDLLVVDDCSRIPVAEVLGPLPANVEVLRLERNAGVVGARNAGVSRLLARNYVFIGVLDADDVSHPDRLARQVAFLKANPGIALVGTWARYIDENTGATVFHGRPPCDPAAIRDALYVNNCTVHSSWMVRAQALREVGLYDPRYPLGEDYELLRRVAARFDVANLPGLPGRLHDLDVRPVDAKTAGTVARPAPYSIQIFRSAAPVGLAWRDAHAPIISRAAQGARRLSRRDRVAISTLMKGLASPAAGAGCIRYRIASAASRWRGARHPADERHRRHHPADPRDHVIGEFQDEARSQFDRLGERHREQRPYDHQHEQRHGADQLADAYRQRTQRRIPSGDATQRAKPQCRSTGLSHACHQGTAAVRLAKNRAANSPVAVRKNAIAEPHRPASGVSTALSAAEASAPASAMVAIARSRCSA